MLGIKLLSFIFFSDGSFSLVILCEIVQVLFFILFFFMVFQDHFILFENLSFSILFLFVIFHMSFYVGF